MSYDICREYLMPGQKHRPTGVASAGPGLNNEAREHLKVIVSSRLGSLPDMESFVDAVSRAVSGYHSARSLHEEGKPATVRMELDKALKAALKLNDRVNALSGTARQSVYGFGDGDELARLHGHVSGSMEILEAARTRADTLQSTGGRLPDLAAITMAAHIAHSIRAFTEVEPTSTSGGVFEEVLLVAMEALPARGPMSLPKDRPDPSLHDLMLKALRVRITEYPGGVVEIDPTVG